MKRRRYERMALIALATTMLAAAPFGAAAEDRPLPRRIGTGVSGYYDVVKEGGVDNTGKSDVTVKLDSILSRASTWRMIYLPRGTYLVSGTVQGPGIGNGSYDIVNGTVGAVLVGESREGTVIRLADGTWPVDNVDITQSPGWETYRDRVVLHGGDCGNTAFGKEMHNFTVNIGKNNAGAIGVNFSTANHGGISDVNIISEDGKGSIGLSLNGGEIGPAYAHSIYVKGFKTGIYASAYDDISIFQVRLEDQTQFGLYNAWTCDIDSLSVTTGTANVPGVFNGGNGRLAMLNGFFTGNSTAAALVNQGGRLFARNIHSTGYQQAISSSGTPIAAPTGADPAEYASHGSAGKWYTPGRSMNLPIKYAPFPPWQQDTAKWASVMQYKGGGVGTIQRPDTAAFRTAFNTPGKTSVMIDFGKTWTLPDTVFIEGPIERVIGTKGDIRCPAVVIRNNAPPVVVLQFLDLRTTRLINRSSKTVILQSINTTAVCEGTGEMFINGLLGRIIVQNPQQKVWMRDFNGEGMQNVAYPFDTSDIIVTAGQVWNMGYKSENSWAKARCTGGFLEMFGMIQYGGTVDQSKALFYVSGDGQFSLGVLTQISHRDPNSTRLVSETRNGIERILTNTESPGGYSLTLYTGYDSAYVRQYLQSAALMPRINRAATAVPMNACVLARRTLAIGFALVQASGVSVRLADMRGRVQTLQSAGREFGSGAHALTFDMKRTPAGTYVVELTIAGGVQTQRIVLTK